MGELIQPVKDGKIVDSASEAAKAASASSTSKKSSSLDKNSFLKLLCTQMQYQDPLNPSSNTEYVAQLATFSELEQMQNLVSNSTNSQAFSLVGKNVTVSKEDDSDTTNNTTISGKVDFVSLSNGKAKLSINGTLYSIDQLTSVTDENFVKEQNSPHIDSKITLDYDADNPKDISFTANMGSGDYAAKNVAVVINGKAVSSDLVNVSNGKVTVNKSAFADLANGSYKVSLVFDNTDYTTVSDKITLQVTGSQITDTVSTGTGSSTDTSSNTSSNTSTDSSGTNTVA